MKSKNLELAVLVTGFLVIAAAVFLMFAQEDGKSSPFTPVVFAVGFLIYILYSIMSSNNLNREIRQLNTEKDGLKQELKKTRQALETSKQELADCQVEVEQVQSNLDQSLAELKKTQDQLKALQAKASKDTSA